MLSQSDFLAKCALMGRLFGSRPGEVSVREKRIGLNRNEAAGASAYSAFGAVFRFLQR